MNNTIQIQRSADRGGADHGWLKTFHSFSFADYYNPKRMGFRSLRVINEDDVSPSKGFGTHPHQNMEILSFIVKGALEHRDSMGNGSVIRPGEIQYMSAGTGVTHSEFNPSQSESTHLLQIWIVPDQKGYPPRYDQKHITQPTPEAPIQLIVCSENHPPDSIPAGAVRIRQDASIYYGKLSGDAPRAQLQIEMGRAAWVQCISGELTLRSGTETVELTAGDGASLEITPSQSFLEFKGQSADFLVFDLA